MKGKTMMQATPETARIGWIGTGVMGGPMCGHLLDAGYRVVVFSRTPARAALLVEKGARLAAAPVELAISSDVIFTIVGTPADVREVIFGSEGLLAGVRPGSILVDMTTSEPSLAVEIYGKARERGAHSVDAPVSGGDVGARSATLSIMVGGDEEAVEAVRPILSLLGRTVVRQGGPGSGHHAKMVNQILVASGMVGLCESLLYGYKAGLDLEKVLQSVSQGAAASWSLSNYTPRILKGNLEPGFAVRHFLKDLGIALAEARSMSLALPGLALAEQLYLALKAQGGEDLGIHGLILALAQLSTVDWHKASG